MGDSIPSGAPARASPGSLASKARLGWVFGRQSLMRLVAYWPLLTVWTFDVRSRSGEPWPFLPFQVSVPLEWPDDHVYSVLG